MDSVFEELDGKENKLLSEAIPLITVLIAGADGEIDSQEKEWAAKIMSIRGYKHPEELDGFYENVGFHFEAQLDSLISSLPKDLKQRNGMISEELAQLNPILAKLPVEQGAALYQSFLTFADHVARASGGFLGFASISRAEAKYVDLPMINAIELPEEEA